jgi:hypothetical protein
MRPEDLGIKGFTPEPPVDHGAVLVKTAATVGLSIQNLTATAEAIGRDNLALRGALDRARGTIERFGVENFHLNRALAEARRHRAILFVLGLVLLAFVLYRL